MTIGVYSNQHDPEEWLNKCIEIEIVKDEFLPLNETDNSIIREMASEIWTVLQCSLCKPIRLICSRGY